MRVVWLMMAAAMAAGPALAKDSPKSGTPMGVHEARHGAWSVSCTPCTSGEEPVCQIAPKAEGGSVALYPSSYDAEKPALGMIYWPRDLSPETEGTLTVAVDGETVRVIMPPDVRYTAMYGDLVIAEAEVTALLPALRAGSVLTLEFIDAAGGGAQEFPLDGFDAALDDMLRHLPETLAAGATMTEEGCAF